MIKTKKRLLLPVCSDRLSCDAEIAEIMLPLPLEDGGGVTEDGRMLFFAIVYLSVRALSLAKHRTTIVIGIAVTTTIHSSKISEQ